MEKSTRENYIYQTLVTQDKSAKEWTWKKSFDYQPKNNTIGMVPPHLLISINISCKKSTIILFLK